MHVPIPAAVDPHKADSKAGAKMPGPALSPTQQGVSCSHRHLPFPRLFFLPAPLFFSNDRKAEALKPELWRAKEN